MVNKPDYNIVKSYLTDDGVLPIDSTKWFKYEIIELKLKELMNILENSPIDIRRDILFRGIVFAILSTQSRLEAQEEAFDILFNQYPTFPLDWDEIMGVISDAGVQSNTTYNRSKGKYILEAHKKIMNTDILTPTDVEITYGSEAINKTPNGRIYTAPVDWSRWVRGKGSRTLEKHLNPWEGFRGLATAKSAYATAMLGYMKNPCIDTHMLQVLNPNITSEERELERSRITKSWNSYEEYAGIVNQLAKDEGVPNFMMQWYLFDWHIGDTCYHDIFLHTQLADNILKKYEVAEAFNYIFNNPNDSIAFDIDGTIWWALKSTPKSVIDYIKYLSKHYNIMYLSARKRLPNDFYRIFPKGDEYMMGSLKSKVEKLKELKNDIKIMYDNDQRVIDEGKKLGVKMQKIDGPKDWNVLVGKDVPKEIKGCPVRNPIEIDNPQEYLYKYGDTGLKLYHVTTLKKANKILEEGLKLGHPFSEYGNILEDELNKYYYSGIINKELDTRMLFNKITDHDLYLFFWNSYDDALDIRHKMERKSNNKYVILEINAEAICDDCKTSSYEVTEELFDFIFENLHDIQRIWDFGPEGIEDESLEKELKELTHEYENNLEPYSPVTEQGREVMCPCNIPPEYITMKAEKNPDDDEVEIIDCRDTPKEGEIAVIVGGKGSGKTATMLSMIEKLHDEYPDRPCYVMGVERKAWPHFPEWLKPIVDHSFVQDGSILAVSEAGIMYESGNKKDSLLNYMMEVARHKDLIMIFDSIHTAGINIDVIRAVDMLLIKEPSILQAETERRGVKKFIKRALKEFRKIPHNAEDEEFQSKAYLIGKRCEGMIETELPSFWHEDVSKSWAGQYQFR